jgi:hypothetical protein
MAEITHDPAAKADFLDVERRWLFLARSYEFSERLAASGDRRRGALAGEVVEDGAMKHPGRVCRCKAWSAALGARAEQAGQCTGLWWLYLTVMADEAAAPVA